jgi:magnesium-transporting ATPase (P-type)
LILSDNEVRTSKYRWYNFIPLNLFEQLKKSANIYFIFISILQTRPLITISGGYPANLMPLVFVILLSMTKDAFEDYQRHKLDDEANSRKTLIYSKEKSDFEERRWKDIHVGDVVKVLRKERIPADMIILQSSD